VTATSSRIVRRPASLAALLAALALPAAFPATAPAQGPAPDAPPAEAESPDDTTAPTPTVATTSELDEILITATATETPAFNAPYATNVVTRDKILRKQYRTTPQALSDIPGVMIQETAFGHGSPYIRGFTSFRNLFLIDGIRLNNSVFRPGPNQYWNTVDPYIIDQLEVVKGPSSVLYGSDAIGGTVNARTITPYAESGKLAGRGIYRFADAEHSHAVRGEVSYQLEGIGFVGGGTFRDFDELRIGDGVQDNVGYSEWHADFKTTYRLSENLELVAAYQHTRQNNVPRTQKTIFREPFESVPAGGTPGFDRDLRRDLDQERQLAYVQAHATELNGFVREWHASISWHQQEEVRDRIRNNGDREFQGFEVNQLGMFFNATSDTAVGELTYGFDYYRDWVSSFAEDFDPSTDQDRFQGPVADDATYDLFGLFVQNRIDLTPSIELTLGGRFTYARVDAGSVAIDDPSTPDPDDRIRGSVEEDWFNVAGNARIAWFVDPEEHWNVFAGVSQGFRAPNLSDLTRDSDFGGGFERPAPGLDPENYIMFEVGTKARYDDLTLQTSFFHYLISDQILRANPDPNAVFNKINSDEGFMQGIEFGAAWRFVPEVTLYGNFAYFDGEAENLDGGEFFDDYPSRLPPAMGQVGLRYEPNNMPFWVEGELELAADADRLSLRDEGDDERIPDGGTPGYAVGTIRGGWKINEHATLNLALENITDENYRVHGSGQNRPGRNLVVSIEGRF